MFSTLLTSTTSRFASVKNTLLATENDGDTEDDTHICRVLRNYYDDKRLPYPGWLPPDPKAPAPQQPTLVMSNVGAGYGGFSNQQQGAPGQSGQLSSLWPQAPSQPQPQPKRRPLLGSQRQIASATSTATVNPHLLPSQKLNSYQNNHPAALRPREQGRQASSKSTPPGGSGDSYSRGLQGKNDSDSQPVMSHNAPWYNGDSESNPAAYPDHGQSAGRKQGLPWGPKAGKSPAGRNQPGYQ